MAIVAQGGCGGRVAGDFAPDAQDGGEPVCSDAGAEAGSDGGSDAGENCSSCPDPVPTDLVSVKDFGAVGDGVTDDTAALQAADASGEMLFWPDGTYRFLGDQLWLSAGSVFGPNVIVKNDLYSGILARDGERVVGLQQNHLESRAYDTPNTIGNIGPAPLSTASPAPGIDLVAHWYNDFGLEHTRQGRGGWRGWYTWEWNHHDSAHGYDPARHPLLGWYRGDDPNVLDWQCYWLRQYGVKAVAIVDGTVDTGTWADAGDKSHWVYQLFNNVPNFKALEYLMYAETSGTSSNIQTAWARMIDDIYARYENAYAVEIGGKSYAAVYVFEGETLAYKWSGSNALNSSFASFLKAMATRMRKTGRGYDGIAVLARHNWKMTEAERADLEAAGVYNFTSFYSETNSSGNTYGDLVDNWNPPTTRRMIIGVPTSQKSSAHPSNWNYPGTTPKLFERWLAKAVTFAQGNDLPRIVTLYNVSEWAEGGPGLQPNMKDGFGYLQALRVVGSLDVSDGANVLVSASSTSTPLPADAKAVRVCADANRVLTATPGIQPGTTGQRLTVAYLPCSAVGSSSSSSLTLQDESALPGSSLTLSSPTVKLRPYDSINLQYSGTSWVQTR